MPRRKSTASVIEAVIPEWLKGLLVADNAIDFQETLKPMLDRALTDDRVDTLIIPIGKANWFVVKCEKQSGRVHHAACLLFTR